MAQTSHRLLVSIGTATAIIAALVLIAFGLLGEPLISDFFERVWNQPANESTYASASAILAGFGFLGVVLTLSFQVRQLLHQTEAVQIAQTSAIRAILFQYYSAIARRSAIRTVLHFKETIWSCSTTTALMQHFCLMGQF